MLPFDYARCADHSVCPRAETCARTEWPESDVLAWSLSQAMFFAAAAGGECDSYIPRTADVARAASRTGDAP